MKVRTTLFAAVAISFLLPMFVLPGLALAEALPQQPATQAPQEPTPPATAQTTLPPQSAQPQGSAPLRVMVDKSLLINTTEQIKRISVTDPASLIPPCLPPPRSWFMGEPPAKSR